MLPKDHPALGAFMPRNKQPARPDWEYIADELAHELQRQKEHIKVCTCTSCLILDTYQEAKLRSRRLRWPKRF